LIFFWILKRPLFFSGFFVFVGRVMDLGTTISNVSMKKAQLFLECSPDQHHEMLA